MDIVSLLMPTRHQRKAETGFGAVMMSSNPPLSSMQRSPQRMAADAQAVAIADITIRAAERVIANRAATVPWHLEDAEDREVGDGEGENNSPAYLAVRDLLRYPYRPQPGDPRTTTPRTWNQLTGITIRHMGVTGSAFWYLDQTDALAGTPLALLYINPARMTPLINDAGELTDWVLDYDAAGHGTRLGLERVIQFQLEAPDTGVFPAGLVETALAKVEVTKLADRHVSQMLSAGGRLSGVLSPREGFLEDAVYAQLVRDIRTISEAPDAAKRMLILRGPVDFTTTTASPTDLDLAALTQLSRDDKLALWGVPHSILGIPTPGGLGGGMSKQWDEAIFWQNAVAPRMRSYAETIEAQLISRYRALGVDVTLEIEEPSFDDETPAFERAQKARELPLTNRERRDLVGLDPFGDARDDEVWLPSSMVNAYGVVAAPAPVGAETYATTWEDPFDDDQSYYPGKALTVPAFVRANARRGLELLAEGYGGDGLVPATITAAREMAAGRISEEKVRKVGPWIARHLVDLEAPKNTDPADPDYPGPGLVAMLLWGGGGSRREAERTMRWADRQATILTGKARIDGLDTIRQQEAEAMTVVVGDAIREIVVATAARVARNIDHLRRKPGDASVYLDEQAALEVIRDAIVPVAERIVRRTAAAVEQQLPRAAKADPLELILPYLQEKIGRQIVTVPRTLVTDIQRIVVKGIEDGLGGAALGTMIEESIAPADWRSPDNRAGAKYLAERIARTEANRVLNEAALTSYGAYGVRQVIAVDGDEDLVCADRNGRAYSVEEAMTIQDHPNGTLTFDPVVDERDLAFAKAAPAAEPVAAVAAPPIVPITNGTMTWAPQITMPQPIINVTVPEQPAPVVHVEAPVVNLPAPVVNITTPETVVHLPELAPVIAMPEVKAATVQDIRIVEMPARTIVQTVVRDPQGRIVGTETAEA